MGRRMISKITFSFFIIAIIAISSIAFCSDKKEKDTTTLEGFSLLCLLENKEPVISKNDDVIVNITIKNVSDGTQRILHESWQSFIIEVSRNGNLIKEKQQEGGPFPKGGSRGYRILKQNEEVLHKVNLSDIYDLSILGKYEVRFKKLIPTSSKIKNVYIESKIIDFQIIP